MRSREIMDAVDGESFTVTRDGREIAELGPDSWPSSPGGSRRATCAARQRIRDPRGRAGAGRRRYWILEAGRCWAGARH